MTDVKWIKIATHTFDDEKILMIESMPNADSIITIWFKLLVLAGKQNNDGVFQLNDKVAYTDEMLASVLRRDLQLVRVALDVFEKLGMIEIISDTITIPNWNKYQTLDAYEAKKERDRIYQQMRREKQKSVIESSDNRLTSDEQKRLIVSENKKENKNKNKKENNNTSLRSVYYPNDQALNEAFSHFLEHRKALKKPLKTDYAIELTIKKLDDLSHGDSNTAINILNQSIANGWQGIFELKEDYKKGGSNNDARREAEVDDSLDRELFQAFGYEYPG